MPTLLTEYLNAWELTDPVLLAETGTSAVFQVTSIVGGAAAVLKIFTSIGAVDEANGAAALQAFNGCGAVRLLRHDRGAYLTEYAPGPSLAPLVRDGRDDEATRIIADTLMELHEAPAPPPPAQLTPLARRFRSLMRHRQAKGPGADPLFSRGTAVASDLLLSQQDICVLHGDMTHDNVRYSCGRGWLAIDPKGLFGERAYDAANVLLNPDAALAVNPERLHRTADALAQALSIETLRLRRWGFAHACLSACWSLEDGDDPNTALAVARLLAPHLGP